MLASNITKDAASVTGVASAAAVFLIYQNAMPSTADIRTAAPYNNDIEKARKQAAVTSAAVLGGVFLVTRNVDSFIIGGLALIGIDFMHKHADMVHPATGKVDTSQDAASIAPGLVAMPDYNDTMVA